MHVPRVREVWSSNPGPAKPYTTLLMVCHRFNIYASSCVALAPWCADGHRKLVICYETFGFITTRL